MQGTPVMVGVEETPTTGSSPNPNNRNALTGHFVLQVLLLTAQLHLTTWIMRRHQQVKALITTSH